MPVRCCWKKTGPLESSLIIRAIIGNNQLNKKNITSDEKTISKTRFNNRFEKLSKGISCGLYIDNELIKSGSFTRLSFQ